MAKYKESRTKSTVLAAIKGSGGVISTIAAKLSVDWHTAKKYVDKWEETRIALADESEKILDLAEVTLYDAIKEGNTQDAKWLLATKGKRRGFTERHELTGADGEDLKITYEIVHARIESTSK